MDGLYPFCPTNIDDAQTDKAIYLCIDLLPPSLFYCTAGSVLIWGNKNVSACVTLIRSGHHFRYDVQTDKAILVFGKHQYYFSNTKTSVHFLNRYFCVRGKRCSCDV